MKLRAAASLEDHLAVRRMGRAFLEATPYGPLLETTADDIDNLIAIVDAHRERGLLLLAVDDQDQAFGMIAMLMLPNPFNRRLVADEIVWWVDTDHRGALRAGPALLDAAENWARAQGAYLVKMVAPFGSKVARYYDRRGYSPIETTHAKVL